MAQAGIAIGASAGAVLLIQMLTGKPAPLGWTLALPANVVAGLVGLLAVFTGALPWYCLLPTLAIPWATLRGAKRQMAGLADSFSECPGGAHPHVARSCPCMVCCEFIVHS